YATGETSSPGQGLYSVAPDIGISLHATWASGILSESNRGNMMAATRRARGLLFLASILAAPGTASAQTPRNEDALLDFFEKKIRPVLIENCFNCHSANTNSKGGLRVDDRNGLTVGGGRGPAIIPGDPDKSLLLKAVRHVNPKLTMPPKGKLSDEEIADLTKWVKDGAVWPKP